MDCETAYERERGRERGGKGRKNVNVNMVMYMWTFKTEEKKQRYSNNDKTHIPTTQTPARKHAIPVLDSLVTRIVSSFCGFIYLPHVHSKKFNNVIKVFLFVCFFAVKK